MLARVVIAFAAPVITIISSARAAIALRSSQTASCTIGSPPLPRSVVSSRRRTRSRSSGCARPVGAASASGTSRRARADEPAFVRKDHGLNAVAKAELAEHASDVRLHCPLLAYDGLRALGVREVTAHDDGHL